MINEPWTGAVLYAKDVDRVVAFYSGLVGLKIRRRQRDHIVLESPVFHLVILRIPKHRADSIEIENPPVGAPGNTKFAGGGNKLSSQLRPPESKGSNHGDDACCAGLLPKGAL
jgi:hypothetical protein